MVEQSKKNFPTLGWIFWGLAALFYAYEFIHRVAPSVLTLELREAFNITDRELGIISAMYFYAYAAFQLPAGILVDKYGVKRLLVISAGILTLGSFVFSTTTSPSIASISRFLIGAGSAFAFVCCLKIAAQWLSMNTFPLAVGLTNLCGTLGALLGGTPLSTMVEWLGWRNTMLQLSYIGLLITLLIAFFYQEKKTTPSPLLCLSPENKHGLLTGLGLVVRNPHSWLIALYGALLVAPIVALPEMWGVEYLKVAYGISAPQASKITHIIFIGTAIGGPLVGWLVTRIQDKIEFMMLTSFGALILLTIFLYWINMPFPNLYVILFCYGLLTTNMLLCFTLVTQIHPLWAQGAAIGFTNMVIMACGGLAQHVVGWILEVMRSGHEDLYLIEDYHIALSVLPFCLLLAITLTFFMAPKLKKNGK